MINFNVPPFVGNEMEVVSVDVCGNKDLGFLPGR